ncbi:ADP-ribosylglycohydrolase family protein [Rubrobacter radiotolerans]|uniref:ADP-ribosylglycohydrolase family protein n=1 Tax=Rubrobacter radiotolerans TaxID=42256 RepID=UPI0039EEACE6
MRTPDSFLQTVSTAIAVGGDVDTTAAMAGAISGARVGLAGLPEKLARRVNDNGSWHAEDLAQLARECSALG